MKTIPVEIGGSHVSNWGDVAALFHPESVETFLQKALGKHALYVEGEPTKFNNLFPWTTLNRLLAYGGLAYPRLRVINGNQEIPPDQYSKQNLSGYPQLLVGELTALLRHGAMLAVDAIEQLDEGISEMCGTIEKLLCVPLHADLYACWCDGSPRGLHWDDQETLLVQIEGRKSWCLFEPTADWPILGCDLPEPQGEPRWQGTIARGDLLYIPRGWWYRDSAFEEPTLYLALTFRNARGSHMVSRLLEIALDSRLMQMDIPRFESVEAQSSFLTYAQQELIQVAKKPGLILGLLAEMQELSDPRTEFKFPWSASVDPLPPSLEYVLVPLLRFPKAETIRRHRGIDCAHVLHNGRSLRLDLEVATILERLCGSMEFTVGSLVESCKGEMAPEGALKCLAELISLGLVTARDSNALHPNRDASTRRTHEVLHRVNGMPIGPI